MNVEHRLQFTNVVNERYNFIKAYNSIIFLKVTYISCPFYVFRQSLWESWAILEYWRQPLVIHGKVK